MGPVATLPTVQSIREKLSSNVSSTDDLSNTPSGSTFRPSGTIPSRASLNVMPSHPIATWITPCIPRNVQVSGTRRRRHTNGADPKQPDLDLHDPGCIGDGR